MFREMRRFRQALTREEYIEKDWDRVCMLELDMEHLTGKEAKELAMEKWQREDKG